MFEQSTISRRALLVLAGTLLASSCTSLNSSTSAFGSRTLLSAASDKAGKHWVIGFALSSGVIAEKFKLELPARAHHIALYEEAGLFVVIARRPGNYLYLGDLNRGKIHSRVILPRGRHLLGHGIFSANGDSFYAPESDYDDQKGDNGRVVHWQVLNANGEYSLERQQDFPSYGVGPHELLLLPDHGTLVIANGGIRTHPESGREKLNVDTMRPSLTYIDVNTGVLVEQLYFPAEFHKASIRHLDVNADGLVALAMQYEGDAFDSVPLVATHVLGENLRFLQVPAQLLIQMKQYVGAIRFDKHGQFLAASCPRGNIVIFWDVESGSFVSSLRSRDGCGLRAWNEGFMLTAGTGRVSYYDLLTGELQQLSGSDQSSQALDNILWDNHLS